MNKADETYINLLRDVLAHGHEKDTRSGKVLSVFGRQIRFDLKEGFPLLTTKKVYHKGIIIELLWFLKKQPYGMNIKFLIENNVHIWDKDAYRWFHEWIGKNLIGQDREFWLTKPNEHGQKVYWEESREHWNNQEWLQGINEEVFLKYVELGIGLVVKLDEWGTAHKYTFGDLGPIYGTQWRSFGETKVDQIEEIIHTLKTNPNDRRMMCLAYNPDVLHDVALPPCHVMMQFYTRPLRSDEREEIFIKKYGHTPIGMAEIEGANIPKYGLSCMWTQRSVDSCSGLPFNAGSYSALTYMIAKLVNMVPDELVGSLGDTHIYKNHIDGVMEQLNREGADTVPQLVIHGEQKTIDDFKFSDFEIVGYNPCPPIKFELNVG